MLLPLYLPPHTGLVADEQGQKPRRRLRGRKVRSAVAELAAGGGAIWASEKDDLTLDPITNEVSGSSAGCGMAAPLIAGT